VRITKVIVFFTKNPKNWFCIFLNFLRVYTHFTSFCKSATLLKLRFYTEVPEKISPLAMWPLAMEGGGAGPNSGAPAPESVGEWKEDG
jgi:hypothetical protein